MWNCSVPQQAWQQTLQAGLHAGNFAAVKASPSRRQAGESGIGYRSAIAFALAAQTGQSALAIAQQLAAVLPSGDFQVAAVDGYLTATWQTPAIARWLDELTGRLQPRGDRQPAAASANLVPAQYACARCTAWLALADREGWLSGTCPAATGCWQSRDPIPWLTAGQLAWFAADWQLLGALVAVADAQLQPRVDWPRAALALSEAMLTWQRQRPLVSLAPAQWGLLVATQRVLVWVLAEPCGVAVNWQL